MKIGGNILSDSVLKQHQIFKDSLENKDQSNVMQTKKDFGFYLNSVMSLNDQQNQARFTMGQVLNGNSDYAHQAMIDSEIASYNLSLAVKTQEKTVQTINQLMNMQL